MINENITTEGAVNGEQRRLIYNSIEEAEQDLGPIELVGIDFTMNLADPSSESYSRRVDELYEILQRRQVLGMEGMVLENVFVASDTGHRFEDWRSFAILANWVQVHEYVTQDNIEEHLTEEQLRQIPPEGQRTLFYHWDRTDPMQPHQCTYIQLRDDLRVRSDLEPER
ncbi:hypothetical protein HN924_02845 [Candidatus Woesearchaeota archaeon]|jgi:hypothetical protein|nr:hypothetical protein [Candidatus Woesearchaeota archaeon]MBT7062880.1 hypothetical protein [Candidatus Woesearchaeota archaeon]MBT7402714.1 hypothetical protein [Candidatus Woesearchaeota archaeon]